MYPKLSKTFLFFLLKSPHNYCYATHQHEICCHKFSTGRTLASFINTSRTKFWSILAHPPDQKHSIDRYQYPDKQIPFPHDPG